MGRQCGPAVRILQPLCRTFADAKMTGHFRRAPTPLGEPMHDLVIRGGTVVDGTGAPARTGRRRHRRRRASPRSATVDGDGRAARSTPTGLLVTPGFVDIHTHYDGQVTWDPLLTPSCWHGVTTVVMGNCGVGFAPGAPRPARLADRADGGRRGHPRRRAVRGHHVGLGDASPSTSTRSTRSRTRIDVGTQVPARRGARLRDGRARRRATSPRPPTTSRRWPRIVREGIEAGALGFSTVAHDRAHAPSTASPCPARSPPRTSCSASAGRSASSAPACSSSRPPACWARTSPRPRREMAWMRRLSAAIGRPGHASRCSQNDLAPDQWRDAARPRAARPTPRAPTPRRRSRAARSACCSGSQTVPPVRRPPDLRAARATCRSPSGSRALRDPEVRARDPRRGLDRRARSATSSARASTAIVPARRAARLRAGAASERRRASPRAEGRDAVGGALRPAARATTAASCCMRPLLNYSDGNLDADPRDARCTRRRVLGLGDGGAHCGVICDARIPTFMLTHWARDRSRGERLPARAGGAQDDRATPPRSTASATAASLAPGMHGRPQRHRLRRLQLAPPEMVARPARRRAAGWSSGPTATPPRSWPAR